jgi:hypothetical protein
MDSMRREKLEAALRYVEQAIAFAEEYRLCDPLSRLDVVRYDLCVRLGRFPPKEPRGLRRRLS